MINGKLLMVELDRAGYSSQLLEKDNEQDNHSKETINSVNDSGQLSAEITISSHKLQNPIYIKHGPNKQKCKDKKEDKHCFTR